MLRQDEINTSTNSGNLGGEEETGVGNGNLYCLALVCQQFNATTSPLQQILERVYMLKTFQFQR